MNIYFPRNGGFYDLIFQWIFVSEYQNDARKFVSEYQNDTRTFVSEYQNDTRTNLVKSKNKRKNKKTNFHSGIKFKVIFEKGLHG